MRLFGSLERDSLESLRNATLRREDKRGRQATVVGLRLGSAEHRVGFVEGDLSVCQSCRTFEHGSHQDRLQDVNPIEGALLKELNGQRQQCDTLKSKLSSMETCAAELAGARQDIAALQQELHAQKLVSKRLKDDLDASKSCMDQLQLSSSGELQLRLQHQQQQCIMLNEELLSYRDKASDIDRMRSTIATLQTRLHDQMDLFTTVSAELSQSKASETEHVHTQENCIKLHRELLARCRLSEEAVQERDLLRRAVAEFTATKTMFTHEIEEERASCARHKHEIASQEVSMSSELRHLNCELQKRVDDCAVSNSELATSRIAAAELARSQSYCGTLQGELQAYKQRCDDVVNELGSLGNAQVELEVAKTNAALRENELGELDMFCTSLNSEISSLKEAMANELRDAKDTANAMQHELWDQKHVCSTTTHELALNVSELDCATCAAAALQNEVQQQRCSVSSLKDQLNASNETCGKLHADVLNLRRLHQIAVDEIERLKPAVAELACVRKTVASCEQEVDDLRATCATSSKEMASQRVSNTERLRNVQDELQGQADVNASLRCELVSLMNAKSELADSEAAYETLNTDLLECKASAALHAEELDGQRALHTSLHCELSSFRDAMTAELTNAKYTTSALHHELQEQKRACSTETSELAFKGIELDRRTCTIADLQNEIHEQKDLCYRLSDEMNSLVADRSELEHTEQTCENLKRELLEDKRQHDWTVKELELLRHTALEITNVKGEFTTLRRELQEEKRVCASATRNLEHSKIELGYLRERNITKSSELSSLREDVTAELINARDASNVLHHELQEQNHACLIANRELALKGPELDCMTCTIAALQNEVHEQKDLCTRLIGEMAALGAGRSELEHTNQTCDNLKRELLEEECQYECAVKELERLRHSAYEITSAKDAFTTMRRELQEETRACANASRDFLNSKLDFEQLEETHITEIVQLKLQLQEQQSSSLTGGNACLVELERVQASTECLRRELHERNKELMVSRSELVVWKEMVTEARAAPVEMAALRQTLVELERLNAGLKRRAKRKSTRLEVLNKAQQEWHDSQRQNTFYAVGNVMKAVASYGKQLGRMSNEPETVDSSDSDSPSALLSTKPKRFCCLEVKKEPLP